MSAQITRRELLKWASAGAGAAAVGVGTYAVGRGGAPSASGVLAPGSNATMAPASPVSPVQATSPDIAAAVLETTPPAIAPAGDLGQRLLVVVEMTGGNDGMSMVVPHGMSGYYDLRRLTAIDGADVLGIDGELGYHPELKTVHARGAAIVQGVGAFESDGSHFEMLARWWSGSPVSGGIRDTGFLGRLADMIGDPSAPAVALSVGSGASPAIASRSAATLAIPGADAAGYLAGAGDDDPFRRLFQEGFAAFGAGASMFELDARLRRVKTQSAAFAQVLNDMAMGDGEDDTYPSSELGQGLRLAAQLFAGDQGVRIVHVPMHGDFDTHDDHSGRYPGLMQDLDASLAAFFADLDQRGLTDRVLVMTTSEFGRTAHDNDSGGLDHGTASNALLLGPVNAGRHGEHPSLTDLDDNGNLKPTVGLDQYYATVAEGWFGVPASEVLDTGATAIPGIF